MVSHRIEIRSAGVSCPCGTPADRIVLDCVVTREAPDSVVFEMLYTAALEPCGHRFVARDYSRVVRGWIWRLDRRASRMVG